MSMGPHLDTIVVPKARTAKDMWWVDVLLTQLEAKLNLDKRILGAVGVG